MGNVIDYGEITVTDKNPWVNLQYVRTQVRKFLYGRIDDVKVRVHVNLAGGEVQEWEFDRSVGFPLVDGERKNWYAEWLAKFQ